MTDITRPRRYVLAGGQEPTPSVALAILGDALNEAEQDYHNAKAAKAGATTVAMTLAAVDALRRARNRVAEAER